VLLAVLDPPDALVVVDVEGDRVRFLVDLNALELGVGLGPPGSRIY